MFTSPLWMAENAIFSSILQLSNRDKIFTVSGITEDLAIYKYVEHLGNELKIRYIAKCSPIGIRSLGPI